MDEKPRRKFSLNTISAFAILFIIMIICAILTWVVPAGEFERALNEETGRMLVVPGTYQHIEQSPVGPWQFFILYFEGFIDAADIIFFILGSASTCAKVLGMKFIMLYFTWLAIIACISFLLSP